LADNIQMAQQLLAINQQILDVMERQKVIMSGQVGITKDIASAASTPVSGGLKDAFTNMNDTLGNMREQILGTGDQINNSIKKNLDNSNMSLESADTWLGGMGRKMRNYAEKVAKGTGHATLLKNVLATMWETSKNLLDTFTQVVSSIWNIGQALWSIPNNVLKGMIALSNDWADAMKPIWEAYENFRKDFGAFYNIAGKALKEGVASAKQMGKLGGASYFSVFNDTAEAIRFFQDQFKGLGPLMDSFGTEIGAMGGKFVYFAKGMGISGEQTKSFASVAKATGKTLEKYLGEVSSMGMQMADAFGIADKSMHQDFAEMTADASHFGNMSVKSMAETIVRTRSLGLEVKTLGKIVDKFLNFDEAAQNASKLSQAFGVNLDTLGLMKGAAAGGGDALDQIRNSMFAAGKDASKMSTAELRLLSSTSGLSEEEARLAFSMSNRGKSMEEIRKQASKNQKKELSQAEMMGRLADSIERVVRVLHHETFFDTFFVGLQRGIKQTGAFTKMMSNLHFSLDEIQYAGVDVGKAFVEMFPGVKKLMSTFSNIFDPKYFATVRKRLVLSFKKLFAGLNLVMSKDKNAKSMGQTLIDSFWVGLKNTLTEVKARINTIFPIVYEVFWMGMIGLKEVFLNSIPVIKTGIIDVMKSLTKIIRDSITGKSTNDTGESFINTFFWPIVGALQEAIKDPALQTAFWDLSYAMMYAAKKGFLWLAGEAEKQIGFYWTVFKLEMTTRGKMYMQKAWDEFPTFMTDMASTAFDSLKTSIAPFISTAMKSVGKTIISVLTSALTGAEGITSALVNPFSTAFDELKTSFGVSGGISTKFDELGKSLASGLSGGLIGGLTSIPEKMMGIFGVGKENIVSEASKSSAESITAVRSKIADITKDLSEIPEIDVPMRLERMGKVLGVKNDTLKIQMNPVNITLNLSVTLEADKLADVLLDTKKIMPKGTQV